MYEDKVKIICNLKAGQNKKELLLNLLFPDFPNGGGNDDGSGGTNGGGSSGDSSASPVKTKNVQDPNGSYTFPVVQDKGLEPSLSCPKQILSLPRLPFRQSCNCTAF